MTKLKLFDKDPLDGKLRLTFRLMDSSSRHNLSALDLVNYVRTIGLKMKTEDADHLIELMCGDEQSFFDEDSFVSFMKNEVSKLWESLISEAFYMFEEKKQKFENRFI